MNSFQEDLKLLFSKSLENKDEDFQEELKTLLNSVGCNKTSHLKYVEEKDLKPLLSPIESRILLAAFKGKFDFRYCTFKSYFSNQNVIFLLL